MSGFQEDFLTFCGVVMVVAWSGFYFVQYSHERSHRENMEKVEAGFIYVPSVMGHWVKK